MKATNLLMDGLVLLEPTTYEDKRGYFNETYNRKDLIALGIRDDFKQDCHSYSKHGTLRGLHAQGEPFPQSKIVTVIHGRVYDVQVDIRKGSKTFGRWSGVYLDDENKLQIYIPKGFLHGFLVVSSEAHVVYKTTEYYDPSSEITVNWGDPTIGIGWPEQPLHFSVKDFHAGWFKDVVK